MIPGAFSCWLRLWGSKIGKRVYWTPRLELLDRHLLDIGDSVVFGYNSGLCGHIVVSRRQFEKQSQLGISDTVAQSKDDRPVLLIGKVTIGDGAFIGAGSRLGPGVVIGKRVSLPVLSILIANQTVEEKK